MRFYANENFPGPTVVELRRLGHDVLTTAQAGRSNLRIPDEDVVAFARGDRRAVLTLNRKDFIRIHAADDQHHGIVVCHEDLDFVRLATRVHGQVDGVELTGQLVRLPKPGQ